MGEPAKEQVARAESTEVVTAFLAAARDGNLAVLVSLLAPDAVMRADLVGQSMGTDASFDGADAVANRFNGSKGAVPVTIDGELGAAWIAAGDVKVVFVFHVESGVVSEVELIADQAVLANMDVERVPLRAIHPEPGAIQ